ncbi:cyclopentanol dehydrogenase [Nematostella vectensis]|uniref:cyclopentanol dehydrogenase n=1 Tax=Nematostella vectensis TaxID=45351 RepID=UPI0020774B5B|nr:cyclopentanol dehydrogenase [Nematostella vectensis]
MTEATEAVITTGSIRAHLEGRFHGRVAIVTGGASGIGKATVERLAREGASVAILDINDELGQQVETDLRSSGNKVKFYHVDVANKDMCAHVVGCVAADHGSAVHILVNNAAYFGSKGLDVEEKDWHKTMSVNVQGYANMVQACHPYMKTACDTGPSGAVVNLASISAHRAQPVHWTYSSSKGAIISMTKCMALDLAKDHIRVNSLSPGWTYSPEVARAAGDDRARWEPLWGPYHMLNRLGEPAEIAAAISFLCSEDASFITAADLPVDGGYLGMSAEGFGKNSVFAGSGN